MDTVVKGEGWTKNAFGAEVSDGKIWGRGACDMKSGLASALTAFAEVAKSQKENAEDIEKLPGTLVFIGTVDEEADMKGSEAAVQQGWIQKEDWVLDMEPTSGMIQMAHKGRTWFELNVEGITAHASMPEKGADAIAGIAFMIAEIRKAMGEVPTHEELGKVYSYIWTDFRRIQSICSIRSQHGDDRYASCSADEYTRGRKDCSKSN